MKHLIGQSQNNVSIYIDLVLNSTAMKNIARQPHLLTLAEEALRFVNLNENTLVIEHDMGRPIGYDFVVEMVEDDSVFYVRLLGEDAYTRFTRKGTPVASSCLSISLERGDENVCYYVRDIWVGHQRPPLPGCRLETSESKPYWERHAFIFQNQPMQTNTLTKMCPY